MVIDSLARGPLATLVLLLLSLALYVPGMARLPVTDRDEARFAQATRQMVETGDYVRIRFQAEPRHKKPAGIHWLQAAAVRIAAGGDTGRIWAYRLPSALGATAAVLALFALARPVFGAGTALVAALILGSALLTGIEAHIAKTDAALLLAAVLAEGALMGFTHGPREGGPAPPALAFLFWGALGAGVLIKGPVLPGIAALTLAALWIADRRAGVCSGLFRALRPVAGAPLFLAIAAPWFIAIAVSDGGFIADAVRGDLLPKLLGGHESHGAPPGFYLATSPLAFWPGVFLVPFGLIWAWRNRAEPGLRFCLAWLIPAWIALELVPTKLVHYTLPLYPAAALMAGQAVTRGHDWLAGALARWPARLWLAVWGLAGAAVCALIPVLGHFTGGGAGLAGWAAAGAAAAALAGGLAGALARRPLLAAALPLPGMVLFIGLAFQAALPGLTQLWPSAAAAGLVAAHPPPPGTAVAAAGYHEPSLVFALGTATALTSPEGAAGRLAARPGALALIESRAEDKFLESSKRIGQRPMKLGSVGGFNLSKGRFVTLTLYRGEPAQP